jgi:hypothetical protein
MSTDREARRAARQAAMTRRTGPDAAAPGSTAPVVRTKTVRVTLDLQPPDYKALNRHVLSVGADLERRVPASEVLRALLALLEDDDIRTRVVAYVREHGTDIAQ